MLKVYDGYFDLSCYKICFPFDEDIYEEEKAKFGEEYADLHKLAWEEGVFIDVIYYLNSPHWEVEVYMMNNQNDEVVKICEPELEDMVYELADDLDKEEVGKKIVDKLEGISARGEMIQYLREVIEGRIY